MVKHGIHSFELVNGQINAYLVLYWEGGGHPTIMKINSILYSYASYLIFTDRCSTQIIVEENPSKKMEAIENQFVPNENGVLDLTHGDWIHLDDLIFSLKHNLLSLQASFNNLVELSPHVGNLRLMRELHLDHNDLKALPDQIGNCVHLKILNVRHNYLEAVPSSIHYCAQLTHVDLGENQLATLPRSLGDLAQLEVLQVDSNDLRTIPSDLCRCPNLQTLSIDDNPKLVSIPLELRDNTRLVLWVCQKTDTHERELAGVTAVNAELEQLAKVADEEKFRLKDEILRLEKLKLALETERPYHYLKIKSKLSKATKGMCVIS